jgi:translation initiation factor IF-2
MENNTTLKTIELPVSISVRDLAQRLEASPIQVIKILMSNGVIANINQLVDYDTAAVVASELGFEAKVESEKPQKEEETGEIPLWRRAIAEENPKNLIVRPPVVTILGHVDHGKTTLLDAIRHTEVAAGEAGGITQHIGAYQVVHKNRTITFLDTPGHAAFSAMRARGAQGADIVILVVAVDDGVQPQTREAIAHARVARVPMIVALNKIDRPDANLDLVKKQLADIGLVPDDWEGSTIMVPVSAKQKQGLDDLLEAILLVADSNQIMANPSGKVLGTVIEAQVDRTRGVVATLLVQNGTLQMGDVVVAGKAYGKIKAMEDFRGRKVRKADPSTPVLVLGLNDVPQAGDVFQVVESEKEARVVVSELVNQKKERATTTSKATLEELFTRFQAGEVKELRLIVKADVQGSLEPIVSSLKDLGTGEIKVNVLHAETGNVSESDVMLAAASKAIIVGFNVSADADAKRLADGEGVSIRLYEIIYRLIEDVEKALKGMLEPEYKAIVIGQATVQAVFKASKLGSVAGCKVVKGEIHRNAKVRILRNGEKLFDGDITSLRHEKQDEREIRTGFECGIGIKGFDDYQQGDVLECYRLEKVG